MSVARVIVEADGGSRGNPGNAGYGALVRDAENGVVLAERAQPLGITTNNVAEYSGLIAGLEAAAGLGAREVDVRVDSKLVVEQMSGRWQVKQPQMRELASRASALVKGFDAVTFTWVPREQNKAADALANSAMDGKPVHRDHPIVPPPASAPRATSEPSSPSRPAVASDRRRREASSGKRTTSEDDTDEWEAAADSSALASAGPGWHAATTKPTTMVLVRHGASVLSPQRRFSGRGDVPLSPDGNKQAERVAARRTADAIARATGLTVTLDQDLVEADFGAWEGLTWAEARERWPVELEKWLASPDVAPPGGESFSEVADRVARARDRMLAAYPGQTIAVVSHVSPLKTLLRLALEAPPQTLYRLQLDVTGVSEVDWYADGPANPQKLRANVRLVNDIHHLQHA